MEYLVGSTGFVGSNLKRQHKFDGVFHSTDIVDAYGKEPELLVYAGVRAEMFLANQDPAADRALIGEAISNIERIRPKACVLISTIAVYPEPVGVDEDTTIDTNSANAYGVNRLFLEDWVQQNITDHLIIRLPAIYGNGLKKNFLYDYIHYIPNLLTEKKLEDLSVKSPILKGFYLDQGNGFMKCRTCTEQEKLFLRQTYQRIGFSALNFTDSRSLYQFYSLDDLWEHIFIARIHGIRKLNLVTPPIAVSEIYQHLCGEEFRNELCKPPYHYDVRSKYASIFDGKEGYLCSREKELMDITSFVKAEGGNCI